MDEPVFYPPQVGYYRNVAYLKDVQSIWEAHPGKVEAFARQVVADF